MSPADRDRLVAVWEAALPTMEAQPTIGFRRQPDYSAGDFDVVAISPREIVDWWEEGLSDETGQTHNAIKHLLERHAAKAAAIQAEWMARWA